MEINLRSMMWHRVGNRSGVHIQYTQWADALGKKVERERQNRDEKIHFVYLKHEIINVLFRRGYYTTFKKNLWGGDKTYIAVFDNNDTYPFLKDLGLIVKGIGGRCLKVLKQN